MCVDPEPAASYLSSANHHAAQLRSNLEPIGLSDNHAHDNSPNKYRSPPPAHEEHRSHPPARKVLYYFFFIITTAINNNNIFKKQ